MAGPTWSRSLGFDSDKSYLEGSVNLSTAYYSNFGLGGKTITSRIIEKEASSSDKLHILKVNTRGRPSEILQDFAIAGIVSPHSSASEAWADFEKRYGSDVQVSNHLFGK